MNNDVDVINVAIIDPIGGHGISDYYDIGLCNSLVKAGINTNLYTCDETHLLGEINFKVNLFYNNIFNSDPFWLRGIRYIRGSVKSIQDARRNHIKIAHFHYFNVGILEVFNVILSDLMGICIIITAHDVKSFLPGQSIAFLERLVYRLADCIIAHNNSSKEEIILKNHIPKEKIYVIPHGNYIRSIVKNSTPVEARKKLGIGLGAKIILFFGQIKDVKGLDLLLRAHKQVVDRIPNAILVIAGRVLKGTFDKYQTIINELNIGNQCVAIIQYIPDEEVSIYYAAADLVVLPYRKIYQSGVLIMAMSYGRPVLASNIPGMAEMITDQETGFLFPSEDVSALANKIIEVLSNSDRTHTVAERGYQFIKEKHGWDFIGRMTADCYFKAIN